MCTIWHVGFFSETKEANVKCFFHAPLSGSLQSYLVTNDPNSFVQRVDDTYSTVHSLSTTEIQEQQQLEGVNCCSVAARVASGSILYYLLR